MTIPSKIADHYSIGYLFVQNYAVCLVACVLLLVTMERFIAIKYPFQHRTHVTTNKLRLAVIITFLLPFIPVTVLCTYIFPASLSDKSSMTQYQVTIGIIGIICIIINYTLLVVSYITIKKSIAARIRQLEDNANTSHELVLRENKKNLRIFIILLTMCTIYTVTFLPMIVYYSIRYLLKAKHNIPVTIIVFNCYYLSSLLNPLITIFYKEDFKHTLFNCFKTHPKRHRQQHQPERHTETTAL